MFKIIVLVFSIALMTSCNYGNKDDSTSNSCELDVKSLILKDRNYTEFPDKVFEYKDLEYLDLSSNSIDQIPKQIIKLKKLKKLYLSNNNIKEIPSYVSEMENLSELILLHNDVEIISPKICSMKNLRRLNLNGNPDIQRPDCMKTMTKTVIYTESNMN